MGNNGGIESTRTNSKSMLGQFSQAIVNVYVALPSGTTQTEKLLLSWRKQTVVLLILASSFNLYTCAAGSV